MYMYLDAGLSPAYFIFQTQAPLDTLDEDKQPSTRWRFPQQTPDMGLAYSFEPIFFMVNIVFGTTVLANLPAK